MGSPTAQSPEVRSSTHLVYCAFSRPRGAKRELHFLHRKCLLDEDSVSKISVWNGHSRGPRHIFLGVNMEVIGDRHAL